MNSFPFVVYNFLWISWIISNHKIKNSGNICQHIYNVYVSCKCMGIHKYIYPQIKYWATSMLFNTNCLVVSFIGGGKQSAGENHRPAASHWQTLSHNVVSVHLIWAEFELTMLVVICTDCIGSCKFNYHLITITTAPI